jgi:hypothetical protein
MGPNTPAGGILRQRTIQTKQETAENGATLHGSISIGLSMNWNLF